jgi:hypothetical protein
MTKSIERLQTIQPIFFFLVPVLLSLLLFVVFNFSCRGAKAPPGSGEITLFYTSDVGGRLDPCG